MSGDLGAGGDGGESAGPPRAVCWGEREQDGCILAQASLAEAAPSLLQVRALFQRPALWLHQNEQQTLVSAPRDHARHPQLRV